MNHSLRNISWAIFLLFAVYSCSRYNWRLEEMSYEQILSTANVPVPSDGIFCCLGDAGGANTKTSGRKECCLTELLDTARQYIRRYEDGSEYTAIAFKSNAAPMYYALTQHLPETGEIVTRDSTLRAKNFFIYRKNSGGAMAYVVTMLSVYDYYKNYDETEISILYMHDYRGYVLFSDLDGDLMEVEYYDKGRAYRLKIYDAEESTHYLTLVRTEGLYTKSSDGQELEPAVCIADKTKKNWVSGNFNFGIEDGEEDEWKHKDFVISFPEGGGGGGTESGDDDISKDGLTKLYTIALYSSDVQKGRVTGSGNYVKGTVVEIEAEPICEVPLRPTVFNYWTGDLEREGSSVTLQVAKDISAVAYFSYVGEEQTRPCVDTEKGLANMRKEMSIAPTERGYKGGTYGITRQYNDGSPKMHKGIDIYAEKGTPIYCQYAGVVYEVRDSFSDDVIVDGSHGNRIIIQSGTKLFFYCHLQGEGKAIGYNNREGRKFKKGDKVYPGEILGYAGSSGNAGGTIPHVHFEVHDNGIVVDPSAYINGKINADTGEITEIKCDELIKIE